MSGSVCGVSKLGVNDAQCLPRELRMNAHGPEAIDLGDIPGDLGDDPDGDAEKQAREERRMQRVRLRVRVPARRCVFKPVSGCVACRLGCSGTDHARRSVGAYDDGSSAKKDLSEGTTV